MYVGNGIMVLLTYRYPTVLLHGMCNPFISGISHAAEVWPPQLLHSKVSDYLLSIWLFLLSCVQDSEVFGPP